jgi:hypothetical protein
MACRTSRSDSLSSELRRLVEDEDGRVAHHRARDGDALALAADRRMPRSPTSVS